MRRLSWLARCRCSQQAPITNRPAAAGRGRAASRQPAPGEQGAQQLRTTALTVSFRLRLDRSGSCRRTGSFQGSPASRQASAPPAT